MIEKKFIKEKKQEFNIKEFIRKQFNYISEVSIERIPIGEKLIIKTSMPQIVIGRRGATLNKLTEKLKTKFGLQNPQVEVVPIQNPYLDPVVVADRIKNSLERYGQLGFKIAAYRSLRSIKEAGAYGAEIVLSGKLPSERSRTWRFKFGHLKKTGDYIKQVVSTYKTVASTKPGVVGIKVSIIPPTAKLPDDIKISGIEAETGADSIGGTESVKKLKAGKEEETEKNDNANKIKNQSKKIEDKKIKNKK